MNMVTKFLSVLGLTVALSANAVAAVELVIDANGTLMGAKGVSVNNTLYDVIFGDGVFGDVVSPFTTRNEAEAASLALRSSVILDLYDKRPNKINGCILSVCVLVTDYSVKNAYIDMVGLVNDWDDADDYLHDFLFLNTESSLAYPDLTLAKWSLSSTAAAAVPEPETFAMMFAGLGLLGFASRRKKA